MRGVVELPSREWLARVPALLLVGVSDVRLLEETPLGRGVSVVFEKALRVCRLEDRPIRRVTVVGMVGRVIRQCALSRLPLGCLVLVIVGDTDALAIVAGENFLGIGLPQVPVAISTGVGGLFEIRGAARWVGLVSWCEHSLTVGWGLLDHLLLLVLL